MRTPGTVRCTAELRSACELTIFSAQSRFVCVIYGVDQKKFEVMRRLWFDGLAKIAVAHPELFPSGVLEGVVLSVSPMAPVAAARDLVDVRPVISPNIPHDIADSIRDLFRQICATALKAGEEHGYRY